MPRADGQARVPALELGEPLVETDPWLPLQYLTSPSLVEPVRGGQLLDQEAGQWRIIGCSFAAQTLDHPPSRLPPRSARERGIYGHMPLRLRLSSRLTQGSEQFSDRAWLAIGHHQRLATRCHTTVECCQQGVHPVGDAGGIA